MPARAWFWTLDYAYVGIRQVRALRPVGTPARYRVGPGAPVVLLPGIFGDPELLATVTAACRDEEK